MAPATRLPWAGGRRRRLRGGGAGRVGGRHAGRARRARLTLEDGTEVGLGTISIAAEDLSFGLPSAEQDPTEFDALKAEFAAGLAAPHPGLPPDRGPEYELHIDTGDLAMPCSRPMKRWSQGELDECRRQIAILLDNGWIHPSRASHAASIVFARKADGSWRFCQDY